MKVAILRVARAVMRTTGSAYATLHTQDPLAVNVLKATSSTLKRNSAFQSGNALRMVEMKTVTVMVSVTRIQPQAKPDAVVTRVSSMMAHSISVANAQITSSSTLIACSVSGPSLWATTTAWICRPSCLLSCTLRAQGDATKMKKANFTGMPYTAWTMVTPKDHLIRERASHLLICSRYPRATAYSGCSLTRTTLALRPTSRSLMRKSACCTTASNTQWSLTGTALWHSS